VEKDYGGDSFIREGENLEYWERVSLQWNLQCTGGAEEVLGSEG
jgi:hypothetical protein